ncbi:hypothetical protein F4802DRAFT_618394 [Xylaria palmicola]|nr:hypothetical protein F4802DRAFT_618394 [Xylaria palmicola]
MATSDIDPMSAGVAVASPPSPDTTIADMQLDRILSRLSSIDTIAKLARRWWQISPCGPFPRSIFDRILQSVESTAQGLGSGQAQCQALTVTIRESTLKPWDVPPDATPGGISRLLAEPVPRLEAVGIVLATAGLAAEYLPESDVLFSLLSMDTADRQAFVEDMFAASDMCITFCEHYPSLYDPVLWLKYMVFALTWTLYGHADRRTWSRSGHLFNDVLAMEIHREPNLQSQTSPSILNDIRSRLFACVYTDDKLLSSLLDKLPRIPRRYCSRVLSASMSSERHADEGLTLEKVLYGADGQDWSMEEVRLFDLLHSRYLLATLREDIINIRLDGPASHNEAAASQMPSRIVATWESIPPLFRFDPAAVDPTKPIIYSSNLLYIEHLDLCLQAQQLLCRNAVMYSDQLLQVALALVTTSINCESQYCRKFGASRAGSSVLWVYALPGAMVLANGIVLASSADRGNGVPLFTDFCAQCSTLCRLLDQALNAWRRRIPHDTPALALDSPSEAAGSSTHLTSSPGGEDFTGLFTQLQAFQP